MRYRTIGPLRTAKTAYIVISSILCGLGILVMAWPDFSAKALGTLCGAILVVFGIVRLAGYFSKDLYRLAFQYDFVFGVLLILVGSVILIRPQGVVNLLSIGLGICFLADGLFKIRIAFDSRQFGIGSWWVTLSCAILTVLMSIVLMLRPGEGGRLLMVITGLSLLFEGILNLSIAISFVKIIKTQQPDKIENE